MDGPALGLMIIGLLCNLFIGTLIGAVFLRAAVALYNKFAGGEKTPNSVPEPGMGKAMGITLVNCVVILVVGFLINLATGVGAGPDGGASKFLGQFISFPVSLLITAAMLMALLPTTFGRAVLVTLCYMVIVLIVVFVVAALFALVFGTAMLVGR